MSLFEFLDNGNLNGKCETNFFHITINHNLVTEDISQYPSNVLGTYIHEYCHYIQFISTLFGASYGFIYNTYFATCRDYFFESERINIPLNLRDQNPRLSSEMDRFKSLKGSENFIDFTINGLSVDGAEIENAKREHRGVLINAVGNENQIGTFNFGYLCIIESMAKLVQSIFDEELENNVHSDIPYNSVYIVCQSIYPEIINDTKLLVSICLCSLHYHNPGVGFFEVNKIHKANPEFNGRDLYRHMCLTSKVIYNNKNLRIRDLLKLKIEEYKTNIQSSIKRELEYYSYVFDNILFDIENSQSHLLDSLYNIEFNLTERIKYLQNFYGVPFIESNDITILARLPNDDATYNDIACLRGLELVINRFTNKGNSSLCQMYDKCLATQYKEDIQEEDRANMSIECRNNQWEKEDDCLMTLALRWCHVIGKEIIE